MKRILISCTYFWPNVSGVTVYTQILANKLSERGHKITILTSRYKRELSKYGKNKDKKIIRSDVVVAINKGVFMPMFWWDSFLQVKENQIIFANLPQVESIWLGLWSKILGKKFIVIHHCEFNFTGNLSNKLISLLTFPIHFMTYILADIIVSYTKAYADTSIFLKYFSKKIKYILPPIVIGKENKNTQAEINKKIGIKKNQKIIGFVGRIAWEKGIDVLIRAVLKINNTKLILVGPYEKVAGDKSYQKLKRLIENNKNVILWGPVKHENLVDYYKIFDCLVLPSTNNLETFGIVQAEAMVSGCPVVASNLPGVRMPVRLTKMGAISKVSDSKDLAIKIKQVLKTKYDKKMFLKARQLFDINKFVDSYIKCLD